MRFISREAAVLMFSSVLAVAALGAAAAPASAGSDEFIGTATGNVAWFHDGDQMLVCDTKKDGLSIEGHFRLAGSNGVGKILHAAGDGNCVDKVWDTYEGANIEIEMCYRDDFVITKCSDWQRAEA